MGETQERTGGGLARGGKYLSFRLDDGEYGLEALKVQEIIGLQTITRVPGAPDFVRGVINLRGRVVPVVSLRRRFGLPELAEGETDRACIIVVHVTCGETQVTVGVIGDAVSEVLDITDDQIEPPPSFGATAGGEYLTGLGKINDKVIMLLDSDRVLSASMIEQISQVV
jgi:purine-binding chemotaxis protein CheW